LPTVYHNTDSILVVWEDWLSLLKKEATDAPRSRARLCLHESAEDSIQEMIIVFCRDAQIKPHRTMGKSESLSVIEGELRMLMFDDDGNVTSTTDMGPPASGKPFITRLSSGPWYTYVPLTDHLVILEYSQGPFDASASESPAWAPDEGRELRAFLDNALGK